MILVGDKLLSEDIFDKQFACDLNACKGACCVEGEGGAPLSEEECAILDDIFDECFEICVFGSCKIHECIKFLLGRTIFLANVSNVLLWGSLGNSNVSNFGLVGRFLLTNVSGVGLFGHLEDTNVSSFCLIG